MVDLDHIALIVFSEECLKFYEKLGFTEQNRFERPYDTVVLIACGNLVLEMFVDPNHLGRITNPEAMGLRHIALSVEDLDAIINVVECEEIRTDWFGRRFTFTKDLDDQPIEINERGSNR